MDPHPPHTHGRQLIKGGLNTTTTTTWDGSSSYSLENMVSMDDHSHIIFQHDQQQHHFLPSLDHQHSSLAWQSASSSSKYNNNNKFPIPSSSAHHHQPSGLDDNQQQYDDHIILENINIIEDQAGRDDMVVAENSNDEEGSGGEDEEQLSAMKEMMYKIAAMQPVEIDPCSIHKPKRRNVRISDDPQSVAARHRRERISEKMRILQRLVPGGTKMDTASMLDEAIRYVKFLKRQIKHHQNHHQLLVPTTISSSSLKAAAGDGDDNHDHLTATVAGIRPGNNKQHQYDQECMGFVAAAATSVTNNNSRSPNADLVPLPHHDQDLGMSSCISNNKQLRIMENKNNFIVVHHHTQNQQHQMDVFSHIYHHHES